MSKPCTSITTVKGETVRIGDTFRDRRASNVRTLEVTGIGIDGRVECTVIRQECEGVVTTPMRLTYTTAERLTGRSFVRVEGRPMAELSVLRGWVVLAHNLERRGAVEVVYTDVLPKAEAEQQRDKIAATYYEWVASNSDVAFAVAELATVPGSVRGIDDYVKAATDDE
ncbi:hypothetical protein [Nocardia abscessus]|uniref:hypothetical protein n=1 Tax=Nocardia abscessus TaxID=120957 RepID=UPI002453A068|nr:hypothetical protein [Nocardia abscessus]